MPIQETLDTFSAFLRETNKLPLSYICLSRYNAYFDPNGRGTNHDVIESYAHLIKKPIKVVANCGYTPEEAKAQVEAGKIDAVQFGMPWISHPDVAKRIEHGKPLDQAPDMTTFYANDGTKAVIDKGYIDYPAAVY
jgi:2,4-dienoyl-CoA reductase-like NADH-dependent reductase (Old Yellow Enzyme family)